MNVEIRKLTPDLLDDWLNFFDNIAFSDNDDWSGCYCMCYHWTEELNSKKSWNCGKEDAPYNRECAINLIKSGKMQGYLAYHDGKVVGWCNANDKYDSVNIKLPLDETGKDGRIKSIVCFCIDPNFRGKGIASRLIEKVCADATNDGYDYVEAYPFCDDGNNAYHGPISMYEKNGFKAGGIVYGCIVYRKYL
jgi:Acetyltransferases